MTFFILNSLALVKCGANRVECYNRIYGEERKNNCVLSEGDAELYCGVLYSPI